MTVPHHIYVIVGQSGSHEDYVSWPVCWRHSHEDALATVHQLNAQAVEILARIEEIQKSAADSPSLRSPIICTFAAALDIVRREIEVADHQFVTVFDGTTYYCWIIADDPRETPAYQPRWFPGYSRRLDGTVEVVICARLTGNDATGDGSLLNPYRTMTRATRDIPAEIPAETIYRVDVTGIGNIIDDPGVVT